MEIQDIRLTLSTREGGTKAFGSFSLDGQLAVRGVRVMEDKNGKNFVAFPSRERANGEYEDIVFPLNKELYHQIDEAIVAEYQRVKEQKQSESQEKDESQEKKQEKEAAEAPKKGKSK